MPLTRAAPLRYGSGQFVAYSTAQVQADLRGVCGRENERPLPRRFAVGEGDHGGKVSIPAESDHPL